MSYIAPMAHRIIANVAAASINHVCVTHSFMEAGANHPL